MRPTPTRTARRQELLVMGLCFAVIVFDGYDLIVYGATVPALLQYEDWGLTPAMVGVIGSYALVGMLIGALLAGTVTDVVGRRKVMLTGVGWFSVAMIGCALAPDATWFGMFRLLAGIGLGGVMPTAVALTAEYSAPERRSRNNALMFSGYAVGGILAAVLAMALLPSLGFRFMYGLGVIPLLMLPLLLRHMPESLVFLVAKGRHDAAERTAARLGVPVPAPDTEALAGSARRKRRGPAELLSGRHVVPALLFAVTSFFGLLLVYGLNTWLPQIMRAAGYPLSSSLLFLLMMNLGAVIGSVLFGPLGDRYGMKPVTLLSFLAAAVSMSLLSIATAAPLMYLLVAVAGFGTIGAQIMVLGYVAQHFPVEIRATALGWTLGIGRFGAITGPLFGGALLSAGVSTAWNFYAFALPAALATAVVLLLPGKTAVPVPAELKVRAA
ncbi:aromatic acid/H+ symport family MFS transporter [Streptomyces sp. NL15-2K]|uniref:MFS transporter n=1 Tax=Streptomyces sp. NL15-2K TaxID=376149 RepID=UPI000FF8FFC4|nr:MULTISPECIES: aromatic acid/H+ symport family MFS transporter [Actinomycetes]WKX07035.1 aromatic acid/H+ symport family MFS transporter [Kutzneria buriramensis]GCB43038.1 benzoate MFS transporter benK [Streptomyces sp. NL15-2K]